jgi:hypothetical protein
MKLDKIMKVVVSLLLIALLLTAFTQFVSAKSYDPLEGDLSDYTKTKDNSGAGTTAQKLISRIINVAQIIGMGVAILMLVVLAIKYISASPDGKAEIKKNATIYIVGAVVLFAASGILQIIRRFAVGINNDAETAGTSTTPAKS